MQANHPSRSMRFILVPLALALALTLAACGGGVSQDDAAEVREQLEDIQSRLSTVEENMAEIRDATDDESIAEMIEEAMNELSGAASTAEDAEETLTPPEPEPIEGDDPLAPADPAAPATPQ